MIEPIFVGGDNAILKKHVDRPLFIMSKRKLRYSLIKSLNKHDVTMLDYWLITTSGRCAPFYFFTGLNHNALVSCSTFLDALREQYPQHFEWLLYHPEWHLPYNKDNDDDF